MRYIGFALVVVLSLASASRAQGDYDEMIQTGIHQIYNIQFDEAAETFRAVIAKYPENPSGRFFLAMIDWWKIMLDLESEDHDDVFFKKIDDVIFQCDEILEKNPDDVNALFFKGGAIGFRGRLRVLRESWLKAVDDGREALPIVQRASELDPDNPDVQLGFGIYNYYAAVVPEKYPEVEPMMMFFPDGDKQEGLDQLEFVATEGRYAKYEAQYFLMTLHYSFEDAPYKAEDYSSGLIEKFPNNPVFERWDGKIAMRQGKVYTAARRYKSIYEKVQDGMPGYNLRAEREATYYIGVHKKNAREVDSAMYYLNECVRASREMNPDDESGFLINSLLYLGNLYDVQGERERAKEFYQKVLDMREYRKSHNLAESYLEKPFRY